MSDFIEYRNKDARLEPAYPRQAESYASDAYSHRHRPSNSKHSRRTQASYASNGTWIPYPDYPPAPTPYRAHSPGPASRDTQASFGTTWDANPQQYPPPPDAIRPPSPAMTTRTRGQRSDAGEPEFEYMSAEADPEMQHAETVEEVDEIGDVMGLPPDDGHGKSGKKRFVGGFVSGLKKLPRAVLWGRKHAAEEEPPFRTTFPQFEPTPHISSSFVQMDVPVPSEPRMPTPALSKHSSHRSRVEGNGNAASSYAHGDTDSTAVHRDAGPSRIVTATTPAPLDLASPNLRPTSDYDKMPTPPRTPTAPSITSYLTRVHRFLKELSNLPWVASATGRVAADYFPGENPRSRYLYPRYREREANRTWYTSKHKDVDLLSGERDVNSRRTTRTTTDTRYRDRDREPAHHRSRTHRSTTASQANPHRRPRRATRSYTLSHPNTRSFASGSYTLSRATSPGGVPVPPLPTIASPTASHLAFMDPQRYAQVSYPYGYAYSPTSPQPMYLIPGPSPPRQDGQAQDGSQQGQGQAPVPVQPAMPVYLVAGLPPGAVGAPPGFVSTSPRQHVRSGTPTPRGGSPKSVQG